MKYTNELLITLLFLPLQEVSAEKYDLVVYGGTSAGIAAAVQMKRMGGSVVVIEPTDRVGGLSTGGLGQTDIGNKQVIGGIAREFYTDIKTYYSKPEAWDWQKMPEGNFRGSGQTITEEGEETQWTFEPSAALSVFHDWIKRDGIEVVYNERLDRSGEARAVDRGDGYLVSQPGTVAKGVAFENGRITSITMESGKTFTGKFFMDATYEGDLFASAGMTFTVGREGKEVHGESLNGVQVAQSMSHDLVDGIDPYVTPGDASSGLLKWIDTEGPGEEHASDHRMQAYCFRMCLTNHDPNRIPFHKPEGYDEAWFEMLFRNYEAGAKGIPWINSSMPDRKTDTNNRDGFSTDFIGENYGWPQGTYAEREGIRAKHLLYQQGLMWSLANHPRVPEGVRKEVSKWGMTKDEFPEGNGWQQQIYVREGRRLVSDYVMTQDHCQRRKVAEFSVGMGAYTMDSHNTQRYVTTDGFVKNEGNIEIGGFPPYAIDYRSIIPAEKECSNLVVPVSLSSTHIAFGSIRMEPVFMVLAQSAATAVSHAIKEEATLQKVDYARLRERLLKDGQVLENAKDKSTSRSRGIVVDDVEAELTGSWDVSVISTGINGSYQHERSGMDGESSALFRAKLPKAGHYEVQIAYVFNENRSTRVAVEVETEDGTRNFSINQRIHPSAEGAYTSLGSFDFKEEALVRISNRDADGFVVIDAVRFLPSE